MRRCSPSSSASAAAAPSVRREREDADRFLRRRETLRSSAARGRLRAAPAPPDCPAPAIGFCGRMQRREQCFHGRARNLVLRSVASRQRSATPVACASAETSSGGASVSTRWRCVAACSRKTTTERAATITPSGVVRAGAVARRSAQSKPSRAGGVATLKASRPLCKTTTTRSASRVFSLAHKDTRSALSHDHHANLRRASARHRRAPFDVRISVSSSGAPSRSRRALAPGVLRRPINSCVNASSSGSAWLNRARRFHCLARRRCCCRLASGQAPSPSTAWASRARATGSPADCADLACAPRGCGIVRRAFDPLFQEKFSFVRRDCLRRWRRCASSNMRRRRAG